MPNSVLDSTLRFLKYFKYAFKFKAGASIVYPLLQMTGITGEVSVDLIYRKPSSSSLHAEWTVMIAVFRIYYDLIMIMEIWC